MDGCNGCLLWHDILRIGDVNKCLNLKRCFMQRSKIGLLLAAAAAYGAYRFSKMTPEQKASLKTKGKDLLNKGLGGLGKFTGKSKVTPDGTGY